MLSLELRARKSALILIFLAAFFPGRIFAAGGLLSGEKDLRMAQTRWFDIIYPARCEKSASILYQAADLIFEEVAAQFGREPFMRLPVVITPATDQLNAFFSAVPYNRIVIFDTSESAIGDLSGSFSQAFLSIFRHELTHAVTYNLKNGFWNGLASVFGDAADLGYLFLSSGMAEGASVAVESLSGEGRLNNEFWRHTVKQAKIEDDFPSYFDVQGASDTYPSGSFYDFNAAFVQWLLQNFGAEKYAEFWYTLINVRRLGVSSAFKKTYGIKIKEAWQNFYDDYAVPGIPANPVQAGQSADFFDPDRADYSAKNRYGARYSSLSVCDAGLAWIENSCGAVYFLPAENYGNPEKARKVFAMQNLKSVQGISLSSDGEFMAVSYLTAKKANITSGVKILNLRTGRVFDAKIPGIKDAAIISDGENRYLVAQRFVTPYNHIEIHKLIFDAGGKITEVRQTADIREDLYDFSGSFTPAGDGRFAFIQKKGLNFSVCVFSADFSGGFAETARFALPDGFSARNLSCDSAGNFYFSWACAGTMPRLGVLRSDGTFDFSSEDISGGVFCPVRAQNEIVYIGKFYRENRLLRLGMNFPQKNSAAQDDFPADSVKKSDGNWAMAETSVLEIPLNPDLPLESSKYNPFLHMRRGIFLPFSLYTSESFGVNTGVSGADFLLPFGATYVTSVPWTSVGEGTYQISAGWGPLTNSFGLSLSAQEGSATDIISALASLKTEFDFRGWKQSIADFSLASYIPLGQVSYIALANSAGGKIGRQNRASADSRRTIIGTFASDNPTVYYRISEAFSARYSNVRSAGPGRFERAGFSVGAGLSYLRDASAEKNPEVFADYFAVTAAFTSYFPHILPFESEYGFTSNLPLRVSVSLFPTASDYGYASASQESFGIAVLDAKAEAVLFGMNVGKSLPFLPAVFIHDFYVAAGYYGTFSAYKSSKFGFQPLYLADYFGAIADGRSLYQDALYIKFALEMNPNIGIFADSSYKMSASAGMKYSLHQLEKSAGGFAFIFEFGATF